MANLPKVLSDVDEFIIALKGKSISSNEAEFLNKACVDAPDSATPPCARARPRNIKRYVQMKQDLVDNIEGPFLHTKHPWASMIKASGPHEEPQYRGYSQVSPFPPISSTETRIEEIEKLFFPMQENQLSQSVPNANRISNLVLKCKAIKEIYCTPDEYTASLDNFWKKSSSNFTLHTNYAQLVMLAKLEKFTLDMKRKFPYIYANEFIPPSDNG
ncbi:hypothetical protein MDAP_002804 [Mitosporidium daphniae]